MILKTPRDAWLLKTTDPKPSTSQDKSASGQQPQDESVSGQQPQDESVSEQQQQDESISEQQPQGASTAEQQPQDKASHTLSSQSSDDDTPLPDYAKALKTFTTKDPSSIRKKLRYSLRPKTYYI